MYNKVLRFGRWHARRIGLKQWQVDECAAEFAIHLLRPMGATPLFDPRCQDDAFLHTAAARFASNFLRMIKRRRAHEICWSELAEIEWFPSDREEEQPDGNLLRQASLQEYLQLAEALSPRSRQIFTMHYLRDCPILQIAQTLGMSRHAVEQSLFRSRCRLRDQAIKQGLLEPEGSS